MIYQIERDIMGEYKRYNNIPEKERNIIFNFINELKITGITEHGIYFYLVRVRVIYNYLGDKFLDPEKNDIINMFLKFREKYTYKTISDYEGVLKRFYKWRYGKVPEFLEIKIYNRPSHDKQLELITKSDIEAMIGSTNSLRDKALISLLYDSGCRIGEILSLRPGEVVYDEYGLVIRVHGKTGNRQVRIVGDSIAYLRDYLKSKGNVNGYVFTQRGDVQLNYQSTRKIILRLKERAGINKRIYPHLFRHTRASLLASRVPEAPLENQMGWVHGSRMTQTYVHLSGRDQDNAILKAYGISTKEEVITDAKPKKCLRCNELNPSNARYCHNCWLPFDEAMALEYQGREKEIEANIEKSTVLPGITRSLIEKAHEAFKSQLIESVLEEILKDPELLKKFRDEINQG